MSFHVGHVAAAACSAVFAATARAGTLTATNACLYSVNGEYRDQPVTLGGVGSPRDAAAGATATLSGAFISAKLPPSLPKTGYDLGVFKAGHNPIPSRVWIAIAAANATPATQVRELSVTASTTIRVASSGRFIAGTPIVVRIPIPDTTWTVAGSGPVAFSQAAPGTLPSLPIGINDQVVPVAGSIIVKPTLANLRFIMDCQPGTTAAPFKSLTPALAEPFATLEADSPVPPAASASSAPRVTSPLLRIAAGRVGVTIACPAGSSSCRGKVTLRSVAPVRAGQRTRVVLVAPATSYRVSAGARRTVRLRLGAAARALMRTRRSLRVRVTLTSSTGTPVKRDLTLTR